MLKYIKEFANHTAYQSAESNLDKPNVSLCVQEDEVHYKPLNWAEEYLTIVALEDGTISFNIERSIETDAITSISYSTDDGNTWTTTANQNNKQEDLVINVNVNEGDKVMWKGIATQMGYWNDWVENYVGAFFSSDCMFDAKGNVMSLLYGDDFKGETILEADYTFCRLFSDYSREKTCGIVNAKDLSLPATTLAEHCYTSMFSGCTALTSVPELSATTLADYCYAYMFEGCTSLVNAPELPATTLVDGCYGMMFYGCTGLTLAPELPATTLVFGCYSSMFSGCTNLTTAPVLPATTLADSCYSGMFRDCTNLVIAPELPATILEEDCYYHMFDGCSRLTTAPVLPATTLANSCYNGMFANCRSLTTAPELPATTLANYCYYYMFNDCTRLNYIKAMFTTTPSSTYTLNWVSHVSATGTFVKNSAAQWDVSGDNGIPSGWTVQTASA